MAKKKVAPTKKKVIKKAEHEDTTLPEPELPLVEIDPYSILFTVLWEASDRASHGKGKDRHANNKPFDQQPIVMEGENFGINGNLQQIRKKCLECLRLDYTRARNELLDVIVYAAASVIILDKQQDL